MERQIEYDWIVKPGGDVSDIRFEYKNVKGTRIDKEGNLVIETKFGELRHARPLCYQVIEGKRVDVEAQFKKFKRDTYSFKIEKYNKDYALIIDPLVLVYSTYLGGSEMDYGYGIAVDKKGAAYVIGMTGSKNFPTKNPIYPNNAGYYDVFITKISLK